MKFKKKMRDFNSLQLQIILIKPLQNKI